MSIFHNTPLCYNLHSWFRFCLISCSALLAVANSCSMKSHSRIICALRACCLEFALLILLSIASRSSLSKLALCSLYPYSIRLLFPSLWCSDGLFDDCFLLRWAGSRGVPPGSTNNTPSNHEMTQFPHDKLFYQCLNMFCMFLDRI